MITIREDLSVKESSLMKVCVRFHPTNLPITRLIWKTSGMQFAFLFRFTYELLLSHSSDFFAD